MFPYEDDIIGVVDNAYRAGFSLPKYYFIDDKAVESLNGEVYVCNPLIITRPQGVEFTYILYWNGKRFKGGYIAINNNYTGVQRGARVSPNGSMLFASHVPELRRCYKKMVSTEPMWLAHTFIFDESINKIVYYGTDDVEFYKESIENLTDENFEELTEAYGKDENRRKPVGFVPSIFVYENNSFKFINVGDRCDTVSKAWKMMYEKCELLRKDHWFLPSVDSYMRTGYAILKSKNKID